MAPPHLAVAGSAADDFVADGRFRSAADIEKVRWVLAGACARVGAGAGDWDRAGV